MPGLTAASPTRQREHDRGSEVVVDRILCVERNIQGIHGMNDPKDSIQACLILHGKRAQ
jgi:hypothetical protein